MPTKEVTLKVGTTLTNNRSDRHDCGVVYTITRISSGIAYCTSGPGKGEIIFTTGLDAHGRGHVGDLWIVKEKVVSRECKCGIYRGDCTYHKDQQ